MSKDNRLEVATQGERTILITRSFEAPRELVFRAWSEPDLLKRWLLGPEGWAFEACDVDFRTGGAYRYVWRNQQGNTMGMGGAFREIAEPERIVATEIFDDYEEWGEAVSTLALSEENGRTVVSNTVIYPSAQARDGMLKSGMEHGIARSYDLLDDLLASQEVASEVGP